MNTLTATHRTAVPPGATRPQVNGMVVVGTKMMFFSHLPMFMSPRDYQAILEGTLSQTGTDPQRVYTEDRTRHPKATI